LDTASLDSLCFNSLSFDDEVSPAHAAAVATTPPDTVSAKPIRPSFFIPRPDYMVRRRRCDLAAGAVALIGALVNRLPQFVLPPARQ
jgi:hypothetical protein